MYKLICMSFCAFQFSIGTICANELMFINTKDTIEKKTFEPIASSRLLFYPYKDADNGFWGIKKSEEIIMTPGFEILSGVYNSKGVFAYRENGKWGVVSIYDVMTPPNYDSVQIMVSDFSAFYAKFKSCNKWGVMTITGDTVLPPIYMNIISFPFRRKLNEKETHDLFLVKEHNEPYKLVMAGNIDILNGINLPDEKYFDFSKDILKKVRSNFKKLKKKSIKDTELGNSFKLMYQLENKALKATHLCENINKNIPNTPISISGFKGTINELGVIDIPLLYGSSEDILQRDPYNIFALDDTMSPPYKPYLSPFSDSNEYSEYCKQKLANARFLIKKYKLLIQLCEIKGYKGSKLEENFQRYLNNNYKIEKEYAEKVERNEKVDAFNAKVDNIANSLTNIINGISAGISNHSSSNDNTTISSNIISPSLDTSTQSSSIDFKAQYLKWESLAKRHYNSLTNTGYRVEEGGKDKFGGNGQSLSNSNYIRQKKALREAQAEMQKIRQKASKNGVSIIQSEYETVTVSY